MERSWKSQIVALEERIAEAREKLDALAAAARSEADARMSQEGSPPRGPERIDITPILGN